MRNAEHIFFIRHARRAGFTIEEIINLTKIDRWFLVQIIAPFRTRLAAADQLLEEPPGTGNMVSGEIAGGSE